MLTIFAAGKTVEAKVCPVTYAQSQKKNVPKKTSIWYIMYVKSKNKS